MDVKNALLHGQLYEAVYMTHPIGFVDKTCPSHVCLLHKCLYGLKQAPRAWYDHFVSYLLTLSFVMSTFDNSLFVRSMGPSLTYLLLYVDDIVITGFDFDYVQQFKLQLLSEFHISDLGNLHYFLELEIQYTSSGIFVNQAKYLQDLLVTSGISTAKSCLIPMSSTIDLHASAPLFSNVTLYRKLVGSLPYLTFTRPHIAFAVNRVSQFMQQPTVIHYSVVKRIFRYLCGAHSLGILFKLAKLSLWAFYDAD